MIELPSALAPWAAELSMLPRDVGLVLAPWVGRLALAVGPLSDLRSSMSAEPDGYGGLSRRGSYERLIATEWGIADLFPDEFLRRAASGEHLFLDRARSGPQGAQRAIAVVSAGPAHLGAPRLAHLAALVVLARRAANAGASFAWGVFEDRALRLNDGVDRAGVRRLFKARTAVPAGDGALTAWRAVLGADRALDWWWIGDVAGAVAARRIGASTLTVQDILEPQVSALDVAVEHRGRRAQVRLSLPAPELCARVIRPPRGGRVGARVSPSGRASGLRFGSGRKLLVERESGEVECWPVPSSPQAGQGVGRTVLPPHGRRVVALGVGRRALLVATVDPADPTLLEMRLGNFPLPVKILLPGAVRDDLAKHVATAATGACGLITSSHGDRPALAIQILPGHLVVVNDYELASSVPRVVPAVALRSGGVRVLAASLTRRSLQWAELHDDGAVQVWGMIDSESVAPVARVEVRTAAPAVHFGNTHPARHAWGPVAIEIGEDVWALCGHDGPPVLVNSPLQVIGVARRRSERMLLIRTELCLAWRRADTRTRITADGPFAAVAVCAERPEVAWINAAGEVVVWSITHDTVLMRLDATRAGR